MTEEGSNDMTIRRRRHNRPAYAYACGTVYPGNRTHADSRTKVATRSGLPAR